MYKGSFCVAGLSLCAQLGLAQNVVRNPATSQKMTQPAGISLTVTGRKALRAQQLNNILMADQFPGANCGAKITTALASLSGNSGQVWVNNSCGLGTASSPGSAIRVSGNQTLRFIEPGTYFFTSFTLTGIGSSLTSDFPCTNGNPITGNNCTVKLQQGNGLNVPVFVALNGPQESITDLTVDGNSSNNLGTSVNLTSVTSNGTTATATCSATCPFVAGQYVNISGNGWPFNGVQNVVFVAGSTFTFYNQQNTTVSGGKATGGTAGLAFRADRGLADGMDVRHFAMDGIIVYGGQAPPNPNACGNGSGCSAEGVQVRNSTSFGNGAVAASGTGNGMSCISQMDLEVFNTKFEFNQGWAFEAENCPLSISLSDFGSSYLGGYNEMTTALNFNIHGTGQLLNNTGGINNIGPAIFISAYNGRPTQPGGGSHTIVGNSFVISAKMGLGTQDLVHVEDSIDDIIVGNTINCGSASSTSTCRYGLNVTRNQLTSPMKSTVIGNSTTGVFCNNPNDPIPCSQTRPINYSNPKGATVTFVGNDENGLGQAALLNHYLLNNTALYCQNSASTPGIEPCLIMDNSSNLAIKGDPTQKVIILQPDGNTIAAVLRPSGVGQRNANGNLAGTCTLSAGKCTHTFSPSFGTVPSCVATGQGATNALKVSATTTALTITSSSGTDTQTVNYVCLGNPN